MNLRLGTWLLPALLGLAGCGAEEAGGWIATSEALSFEEWAATLERNDRGAYMVEGDIAIYGEEKLLSYFEEMPHPGALTVITENGKEMRWSVLTKYDLTYCVDDNIGTNKQQVVDAMNAAARAWEGVAEVRFVYVPSEDDACDSSNTSVLFNVRTGDCGSSCQASAFFPGDARSAREVLIDTLFWSPSAPYTQVGILTHELGHILGFRHEHIWTSCTTEGQVTSDGRSGTQLTPTDNASVMFYLWCSGATHTNGYQISEQDALGAACKYNESVPRSACDANRNGTDGLWRSNGASRTWSSASLSIGGLYHPISGDFDGDGSADILFYGRGTRGDFLWWANGAGSFTYAPTEISGLYEPVAGDFDGDGRDDIFWYGGKSRADYIWYGNANRTFSSVTMSIPGEYRPLAGDFDGDGNHDLLLYAPGSGADLVMWSNGNRTFTNATISMGGNYEVFVVDQNGDGRDDIFWYAPGTTVDPLWRGASSRQFSLYNYSVDGTYTPIVGNFDGQSGEDIIWYAPGSNADFVWYSNGPYGYSSVSMTITGSQIPVPGDFNNDGDSDILWYAPF